MKFKTEKRFICLLLIAVIAIGLFGCSKSNNELFTDEFFEGVVSIRNYGNEPVNDEQMKPVIEYLKNLKLEKTDECLTNIDENGNLLYGALFLSFTMTDGTEIHLLHNDKKSTVVKAMLTSCLTKMKIFTQD